MATAKWNKKEELATNTTVKSKYIPKKPSLHCKKVALLGSRAVHSGRSQYTEGEMNYAVTYGGLE